MGIITFWLKETQLVVVALMILLICDGVQCRDVSPLSRIVVEKRAKRVCGQDLAMLISNVCEIFRDKRSILSPVSYVENSLDYSESDEVQEDYLPFISRIKAAMIPTVRNNLRTKRPDTLVTECCLKGCSFKEMTNYCDGKGSYNQFT